MGGTINLERVEIYPTLIANNVALGNAALDDG